MFIIFGPVRIMNLSITTFSIRKVIIITLSIRSISIRTLSIKEIIRIQNNTRHNVSKSNNTQHNDTRHIICISDNTQHNQNHIKVKKICSCTGCQNLAHFAECHYIKTLCIRELIRLTLVIMSVNLTTPSVTTLAIVSVYLTTLNIIRISFKANKIWVSHVRNAIILNVVVLHVVDPLLMHLNARLVSSLGSIKISAAVEKSFVFYHGINLLFLTIKM